MAKRGPTDLVSRSEASSSAGPRGEQDASEVRTVIFLSEYRKHSLRAPDDDPPRPKPAAARAWRYGRSECRADDRIATERAQ